MDQLSPELADLGKTSARLCNQVNVKLDTPSGLQFERLATRLGCSLAALGRRLLHLGLARFVPNDPEDSSLLLFGEGDADG
jgi:hypothetical protein